MISCRLESVARTLSKEKDQPYGYSSLDGGCEPRFYVGPKDELRRIGCVELKSASYVDQARARELWDLRGPFGEIPSRERNPNGLSDGEDMAIRALWATMPSGSSRWIDAFFLILQGSAVAGEP
jgi:hypothetical protein